MASAATTSIQIRTSSVSLKVIGSSWPGWSGLEDWFAFGDSWTDVHFDPSGERPSAVNPIGNPAFPGWTSAHGPNYLGFLVSKYKQSSIRLNDFAVSGSVINSDVVSAFLPYLNLGNQVKSFEMYGADFDANRSLFSAWFGINDVSSYDKQNPQLDVIKKTYLDNLERIYDMGARNFLIINVPPIDVISKTYPNQSVFPEDIAKFNNMISETIQELLKSHNDITLFVYDVHELFEEVIASGVFKNSTSACPAYASLPCELELTDPTAEDEAECGAKLEEYLWLDGLHITWAMHGKIAEGIYNLLSSTGTIEDL